MSVSATVALVTVNLIPILKITCSGSEMKFHLVSLHNHTFHRIMLSSFHINSFCKDLLHVIDW